MFVCADKEGGMDTPGFGRILVRGRGIRDERGMQSSHVGTFVSSRDGNPFEGRDWSWGYPMMRGEGFVFRSYQVLVR